MKPRKLISSRYSISSINNNKYQTISVTGSIDYKIGNKLSEQGYVFAPYIIATNTSIIMDVFESRIDKLKRLINKKDA